MALGTFVAGRFSASYDPVGATAAADIGIMEQGYRISARVAKELIGETDAYGLMVVDAIYRGYAAVMVQGVALEWKAGLLNMLQPYAALTPTGATSFTPGVIARLDSALTGILIFTSTAGTPAASAPATMTATNSIFAEDTDFEWMLNSTLRKMPYRMRIYPYDATGTITFFTAT